MNLLNTQKEETYLPWTLYARSSTGKILKWKISVQGYGAVTIITKSGEYEGKQVRHETLITEGKNLGKVNETTPLTQAIKQAHSKIKNQKKKGYKSLKDLGIDVSKDLLEKGIVYEITDPFDSSMVVKFTSLLKVLEATLPKFNTDNKGNAKPMKAQPFWRTAKRKGVEYRVSRMSFPCYGQPKINGVRSTMEWTNKLKLRSKLGLDYNLPHITSKLTEEIFRHEELSLIFDGELYIHLEKLSNIVSAVRKPNLQTPSVEFRVFDLAIPDVSQKDRLILLNDIFDKYSELFKACNIVKVPTYKIKTLNEAIHVKNIYISQNYEGAIFRDMKATYQFGKRARTMTKLKDTTSSEFLILDILPMEKRPELGMFLLRNDLNQETFTVVPNTTEEVKKEYLNNPDKYKGKLVTLDFYERTKAPKELPFHIVNTTIRDYE